VRDGVELRAWRRRVSVVPGIALSRAALSRARTLAEPRITDPWASRRPAITAAVGTRWSYAVSARSSRSDADREFRESTLACATSNSIDESPAPDRPAGFRTGLPGALFRHSIWPLIFINGSHCPQTKLPLSCACSLQQTRANGSRSIRRLSRALHPTVEGARVFAATQSVRGLRERLRRPTRELAIRGKVKVQRRPSGSPNCSAAPRAIRPLGTVWRSRESWLLCE
jgi:hypothetical protein